MYRLMYHKKTDTYIVGIYGGARPVGKVLTEPIRSTTELKFADFRLEVGFDHFKQIDLYRVVGINNDFVGEWVTSLLDVDLGFK